MVDVYVGLGSNVEPERHLSAAVEMLGRAFGTLLCSAVYRSPAFGFSGADFLNAVAVFGSVAQPERLAATLAEIELAQGRGPAQRRFGPRTLDLDLLLYGARVDPRRKLPRDDVLAYPFVLAPLAELAPALVHPVTGEAIAAAWQRMAETRPELQPAGTIAAGRAAPVTFASGAPLTSRRCGRRRPR